MKQNNLEYKLLLIFNAIGIAGFIIILSSIKIGRFFGDAFVRQQGGFADTSMYELITLSYINNTRIIGVLLVLIVIAANVVLYLKPTKQVE